MDSSPLYLDADPAVKLLLILGKICSDVRYLNLGFVGRNTYTVLGIRIHCIWMWILMFMAVWAWTGTAGEMRPGRIT